MTVSHGEMFSRVHSPAAMWLQSVSTLGFKVCSRESGIGSDGTGIINWLAFQDHPKITHGRATFDGIWTTETKCDKVTFSQVRKNVEVQSPKMFKLSRSLSLFDVLGYEHMYIILDKFPFLSWQFTLCNLVDDHDKTQIW